MTPSKTGAPAKRRARGSYARGLAAREDIVKAAHELILERGFYGASLGLIAERTGLTRSGVQHHFESKEHILLAVMESRFSENRDWFQEQMRQDRNILDVMVERVERQVSEPESAALVVALAGSAIDPNHPAHDRYQSRYDGMCESAALSVKSNQARGLVRGDVDPDETAVQLVAMMEGLLLNWLNDHDRCDPVAAMASFVDRLRP